MNFMRFNNQKLKIYKTKRKLPFFGVFGVTLDISNFIVLATSSSFICDFSI